MLERLDFVYLPSRDVAADVAHFTDGLGAELVFAIEAFDTRVAMVRLCPDPPRAVARRAPRRATARSSSIACQISSEAVAELRGRGVEIAARFEIPHGPVAEIANPGPQRVALYELTRPEVAERLAGRRDF